MALHPVELTDFEHQLYERQMPIPGIGAAGQQRLKGATVLISRVGGLGGTVAMLLARAGVGALVLAHDGEVEPENLNRMHLAFYEDLHQPRIEVFCRTLRQINPDLRLVAEPENIHSGNVARLVEQADVVVDGAPLFAERYAMNQEAVRQRKPLVMAAQYGLEGYISTFLPGSTACLSCVYPTPPEDWNLRCFPVIAPSSALVGTIAAMEAIKLLTGCGSPLANQLLYFDLTNNMFQKLRINRRDDCPVCGNVEA
ncbi:MAG TPA: HesA/MoeB/ThiF family protein [Roseiflexaceae bacterium]|nr:HesA/MoeB/ThiF family protein [Roseiflexaceae bacterium]